MAPKAIAPAGKLEKEHHISAVRWGGTEDVFSESGKVNVLLEKYGLTAEHIVQEAMPQ